MLVIFKLNWFFVENWVDSRIVWVAFCTAHEESNFVIHKCICVDG